MEKNKEKLGIYIHIPFCEQKCSYCGFLSFPKGEKAREDYVAALCCKIKKWAVDVGGKYNVDTVFIGGGTPSLLSEKEITDIMTSLKENFDLADQCEITIESNPNSLTLEKLKCYLNLGINRLSMGLQSMDDKILKTLGRIHNGEEGKQAYYLARKAGFKNINLDLMFAISGQTKEIFKDTLEEVIAMNPDHISFYSLQIEEGTKFYDDYKNEKYEFISDELMNEMYLMATDILKENGYEKYEISNVAKDGKVCRHNLKYWSMDPFLGIGLGASGFIENYRYQEATDLNDWSLEAEDCQSELARVKIACQEETKDEQMGTYIITAMRRAKGISFDEFRNLFGCEFQDVYGNLMEYINGEIEKGNLIKENGHIRFTDQGMLVSNDILCEFV